MKMLAIGFFEVMALFALCAGIVFLVVSLTVIPPNPLPIYVPAIYFVSAVVLYIISISRFLKRKR